jgi:hypothetical protein
VAKVKEVMAGLTVHHMLPPVAQVLLLPTAVCGVVFVQGSQLGAQISKEWSVVFMCWSQLTAAFSGDRHSIREGEKLSALQPSMLSCALFYWKGIVSCLCALSGGGGVCVCVCVCALSAATQQVVVCVCVCVCSQRCNPAC